VTAAVIGFVGLGNMGGPMAGHIAAAGFDVVGFDAAGTDERLPPGATAASGVEDVAARADTMLFSLPDGTASLDVASAIAAAAPRRVTTVVDLSTVGPAAAAAAADALARVGVTYVDGPVSGGTAGARARTISLMFAGPDAVFEAHRPLFDAFAGNVFHVGTTPGQGQAMKLLNNFLSATALAATSEALAFGRSHGLDLAMMLDVVNASSGRNTATDDKFPRRVLTATYDAGFRTALMAKDLRLYVDMVGRAGTPGGVGRCVSELWQRADATLPGSDFTQIWQFVSDDG
jgi:3-hydroxyisobutyrate dehydrogenase